MKYRTDFVTNSSSSSYVMVNLETNKRSILIDNEYEGDPGRTFFESMGHLSSYSDVINYIVLVKLREYAKKYYKHLEVDSEGDSVYFSIDSLKEEYENTRDNDLHKIIFLYDMYNTEFELSSFEELMSLDIWKEIFDFDENESLIEVCEFHYTEGDWGRSCNTNTTVKMENLDCSIEESMPWIFEWIYSGVFFENQCFEYLDKQILFDLIGVKEDIECLRNWKFFYKELSIQLIRECEINNILPPQRIKELIADSEIDISYSDFEFYDSEVHDSGNDILEINNACSLIELAKENQINIKNAILVTMTKLRKRIGSTRRSKKS